MPPEPSPPGTHPGRWWQTPAVVAGLAVTAAALTVAVHGWRPDLPASLLLAVAGVILAVEDFAHHRLPNAVLAPAGIGLALLLTFAALLTGDWAGLLRAALAAVACGAGFLLLALARPTGLGMGDVKLAVLLGGWLGWLGWGAVVLGVLAAFVLGGLAGLVLIVARRATRRTAIAFGPWLLLGAAVASALTVRAGPLLGL